MKLYTLTFIVVYLPLKIFVRYLDRSVSDRSFLSVCDSVMAHSYQSFGIHIACLFMIVHLSNIAQIDEYSNKIHMVEHRSNWNSVAKA